MVPATPPSRGAPGVAGRRGSARVLRVVAARQLRMESRLLQTLWASARRLRDAAADNQRQWAVLFRGHSDEWSLSRWGLRNPAVILRERSDRRIYARGVDPSLRSG